MGIRGEGRATRILLVEDDAALSEAVGVHLKNEGYILDYCHDGETGQYYALQNAYDLILLDRMLPELDGIALLRALREKGICTPVLLLTALGSVDNRVEGLDAGADDYLVKPFAVEELLARVRALTRRPARMGLEGPLEIADLTLDPLQKQLSGPDGIRLLSKTEAAMLEIFFKNPRQALPRGLLFLRVWGPDTEVDEKIVDNYVHFVRRRLNAVGSLCAIRTVRSVGYQFEVPG